MVPLGHAVVFARTTIMAIINTNPVSRNDAGTDRKSIIYPTVVGSLAAAGFQRRNLCDEFLRFCERKPYASEVHDRAITARGGRPNAFGTRHDAD